VARAGTPPVNAVNKVEATRAQGCGGAGVAVGRDPALVWMNPASLAGLAGASLTMGGQRGPFGDLVGQVVFGYPIGPGAAALGCLYYDTGQVDLVTEDFTRRSLKLQQDVLVSAGYGIEMWNRVSAGGAVKGLRTELLDGRASTAVALDLGAQVRLLKLVKAGVAISNLGTRLKYLDHPVDLPTVLRAGLAAGWRLGSVERGSVVIALADVEQALWQSQRFFHAGAEYRWREMISVRAGTRFGEKAEAGILAGGVGVKWSRYRLDYSIQSGGAFELPQTLSVTVQWPGRAPAAKAGAAGPEQAMLNLAVAELKSQGTSAADAAVVSDMLRAALVRTRAFKVVDRSNMETVMAEQMFQQYGCTTEECAVKLGRLLNVQRMVVGTFGKLVGSFVLTIQVVDVETGEAVHGDTAKGETVGQVETAIREVAARIAREAK
jgi:TolB-like protein